MGALIGSIVGSGMVRERVFVLVAAVCFGTTGTARALGPEASPVTVGAVRIVLGAVLLAACVKFMRARSHSAPWPRLAVIAGGVGVAAYALTFFAAVKSTGVAVGTVVALGSAPVMTGLGGRLTGDAPLPARWGASTALAVAGVALIAFAGGDAEVKPLGVLLALGAGASYAGYTLAAKRLLDVGHRSEEVMAAVFGLGAVLLTPVVFLGDIGWVWSAGGIAMALWLAIVPTTLAYLLFAAGLRRLAAGEVATLTLAEPVTAVVLAAVVLGERPGVVAIAGVVTVLAGLALLALPQGSARPGPQAPVP